MNIKYGGKATTEKKVRYLLTLRARVVNCTLKTNEV